MFKRELRVAKLSFEFSGHFDAWERTTPLVKPRRASKSLEYLHLKALLRHTIAISPHEKAFWKLASP